VFNSCQEFYLWLGENLMSAIPGFKIADKLKHEIRTGPLFGKRSKVFFWVLQKCRGVRHLLLSFFTIFHDLRIMTLFNLNVSVAFIL